MDKKLGHSIVIDKVFATGFGSGLCPFAPGTAGSAVATAIWYLYSCLLPDSVWTLCITLFLIVFFSIIGIGMINRVEKILGSDPPVVVIDEFIGQWIVLLAVSGSTHWWNIPAAFLLFRLFDILKPLGCGWIDKNVHGGTGVILDDVLAGIYGFIVLMGLKYFLN